MWILSIQTTVVVCTDRSGKELHGQVGVGRMVTSRSLVGVMVSVVVCTDLSCKEPHRQVGMSRVVSSGSLGHVMVSTPARNARDVGLILALDTIFPI